MASYMLTASDGLHALVSKRFDAILLASASRNKCYGRVRGGAALLAGGHRPDVGRVQGIASDVLPKF